MLVSELIGILQEMPQNARVFVHSSEWGDIPLGGIPTLKNVKYEHFFVPDPKTSYEGPAVVL